MPEAVSCFRILSTLSPEKHEVGILAQTKHFADVYADYLRQQR
ncbi:hypothetical protein [Candidatus Electronema sp. PJ]